MASHTRKRKAEETIFHIDSQKYEKLEKRFKSPKVTFDNNIVIHEYKTDEDGRLHPTKKEWESFSKEVKAVDKLIKKPRHDVCQYL